MEFPDDSKRGTLSLSPVKPEHEIAKLEESNLRLYLAVEGMYEAMVNHRLNTADPTVADVTLWQHIENYIDVK